MGILLAELPHSTLQRAGHIAGVKIFAVEELHKLGSALVVHIPEGEQKRGSAGIEQASLEAEQLVTGGDEVHAGGAATEGNEIGVQPDLVEIEKIQVAIAEADSGKH